MCTDANSSGVRAANNSPYTVKDAKVLLCQGRVALTVDSSLNCGRAGISSRFESPALDIQERFPRVLEWERDRFIPVHLTIRSMSTDWVLYASLSGTRLGVAVGKTSGEPSSSEMVFAI